MSWINSTSVIFVSQNFDLLETGVQATSRAGCYHVCMLYARFVKLKAKVVFEVFSHFIK